MTDFNISRAQSLQLKGAAILMMLFLHLFNTSERVAECQTYLNFLDGKPLVLAIAKATGMCVPIYLFISGYGFALARDFSLNKQWYRFRQLYGRYLLAFIVFIGLGVVIAPDRYPGSSSEFVLNIIVFSCTYNEEWWFLFPYFVILLTARWTTALVQRIGFVANISLFLILLVLANTVNNWIPEFFGYNKIINILITLPSFHAGCIVATYPQYFLKPLNKSNFILVGMLLTVFFLKMLFWNCPINTLFALAFILFFVRLHLSVRFKATLEFFGKYSVFIWLTHTFYAYYLFHDWIYGLQFPMLIYIVLLVVTCITSMLLEFIVRTFLK